MHGGVLTGRGAGPPACARTRTGPPAHAARRARDDVDGRTIASGTASDRRRAGRGSSARPCSSARCPVRSVSARSEIGRGGLRRHRASVRLRARRQPPRRSRHGARGGRRRRASARSASSAHRPARLRHRASAPAASPIRACSSTPSTGASPTSTPPRATRSASRAGRGGDREGVPRPPRSDRPHHQDRGEADRHAPDADAARSIESLRRLQTDHVDIYLNHAVNDLRAARRTPSGSSSWRAREAQGKIRFAGMSGPRAAG